MSKKKGGIAALLPLALMVILMGAGFFWLVTGLICTLCGVAMNYILWIIAGSTFLVGLVGTLILKLKERSNK